jgi:hypothetical protein
MQSVLLTKIFAKQVLAIGLSDGELQVIVEVVVREPMSGDLMAGTGGARKLRHAAMGKGKSGGVRTIHYFGGDNIPVFLLAIYGKSEKGNLTKSERNELAKLLPEIGGAYRNSKRSLK